jgi:tetratricopeptide (TPR) repeat protein
VITFNRLNCALILIAVALTCAPATAAQLAQRTAQASANSDAEFDRLVKLADDAREAERFDEAISNYGKALNIKPKWPEGWWYIGAIFYQTDKYPEARDAFQNLVALEQDRGPAWAMLGLCQFQTGEYEKAAVSLERSRTLGVNDNSELAGVVRYHMALLYDRFEYFENAYEVLNEFVRVGHESPKIVEAFGLTLLRMAILPKDIPADQREKILLAGQAGYNMAARRLEQTRGAFDALLSKYPNDANIHYAFGVYMLPQDADVAMKEF